MVLFSSGSHNDNPSFYIGGNYLLRGNTMKTKVTIYRLTEHLFDFREVEIPNSLFRLGEIEFYGVRPRQAAKLHALRLSREYEYIIDESNYLIEMSQR